MKILIVAFVLSLICLPCMAQTAEPQTHFTNVFGAGISYDDISKPSVTASILEAHLLTSNTSSSPAYSFTLVDVSPNKTEDSKIIWQTAVTTGIGTQLRDLGPLGKTWIVGTIGGGVAGENSGLAWSAGGAWTKPIGSSGLLLMADLRALKVANSAYQTRIGFKLCFGNK